MKNNKFSTILAVLVLLGDGTLALSQQTTADSVDSCETVSLARAGAGVAYTGSIENSDYRFSARIPAGLTGWGAGPGAPFHGFTIYLNQASELACIDFRIGRHVELPEDSDAREARPIGVKNVKVGNRIGLLTSQKGVRNGTEFENLIVSLEIFRAGHRDDVTITLVTRTKDAKKTRPTFEQFISHLSFR